MACAGPSSGSRARSWSCGRCASARARATPSRPRPCARTRASRRTTAPTRRSSSGASAWWPRWSRGSWVRGCWGSWAHRAAASPRPCAPGCCRSWPVASCRAPRTGPTSCCAPASTRCGASRPRPPRRRRTGALLIAVDQFDEAFTLCADEGERAAFVDALVGSAGGSGSVVVLALRAEFYGRCAAYPELATAARRQPRPRRPDAARRAAPRDRAARPARGPARRARAGRAAAGRRRGRAGCAAAALDRTVRALAAARRAPPAPRRLRAHRRRARRGRSSGRGRLRPPRPRAAGPSRDRSCCASPARTPAPAPCGGASRSTELDADRDDVRAALDALTGSRLVLVDAGTAEVAHEALLREWPRLRRWLEEDADGRRLHRRLAVAAREWDGGGRDPGELYRGARLASTLDWSAGHGAELNELERAFVEASVAHGERRGAPRAARQPAPARPARPAPPRCWSLAGVAGVLFLDQRGAARDEARTAVAQRLGAQALVEHDLDRSLLLARQGVAIDDSLQTRSNLLAALMRSPAAIGVMRVPDSRLLRIALRPDGRALVAGDNRGTLVFLDPRSRRALRPSSRLLRSPILALAFSRDGSRLAVGGQGTVAAARRPHVPAHRGAAGPRRRVRQRSPSPRTGANSSRPPRRPRPRRSGPSRACCCASTGAPGGARTAAHDRRARRARRRARVQPGRAAADHRRRRDAVRARDARGRRPTGDRSIVVRDARTLRPLRRFPALAFAGAVSPDARTFAIGGQDGSVRFLDLRTGKLRTASGRHAGAVQSAVFTADGRFLVTVGDDANAIVWDVARRAGDRDVPGPRRPRARGGRRPPRAHALHRGPGRQRHRVGSRRGPAAGSDVPGRNGKR